VIPTESADVPRAGATSRFLLGGCGCLAVLGLLLASLWWLVGKVVLEPGPRSSAPPREASRFPLVEPPGGWQLIVPALPLLIPGSIAVASNGDVHVRSRSSRTILRFNSDLVALPDLVLSPGRFPQSLGADALGQVFVSIAPNGAGVNLFQVTVAGELVPIDPASRDAVLLALKRDPVRDQSGNRVKVSRDSHLVAKEDLDDRTIWTWRGEGSEPGRVADASALAVDSNGSVYIGDPDLHRLLKLSADGRLLAVWRSDPARVAHPLRVTFDSTGNLYVLDDGATQLRKYSSSGQFLAVLGQPGSEVDQFSMPDEVVVDSSGSIYLKGGQRGLLQKFLPDGSVEAGWVLRRGELSQPLRPRGLALDSAGTLYLTEPGRNQVQKWLADGEVVSSWPPPGSGLLALNHPGGLAVDRDGFICVVDLGDTRLQQFSPDGELVGSWTFLRDDNESGPGPAVRGLAVDELGRIHVALEGPESGIHVFDRGLRPVGRWANRTGAPAALQYPRDLAFSQGNLYLVDSRGVSVLRLSAGVN
jgi:sugar lactone lactonase YvrE